MSQGWKVIKPRLEPKHSNSWSSAQFTTPWTSVMHFFCFFPFHSEMSIAISPNFGKCINMRDNTSSSSINPLGSEQTYEPYKAGGLWSRGSFGELCLVPNPINTRSEHVHINLSSLIPSAITLYSAFSITKHMHIFVTKI